MTTVTRVFVTVPAAHPRNHANVALHESYTFADAEQASTFMDEVAGVGINGGCIVTRWENVAVRQTSDEALQHLWSRARK